MAHATLSGSDYFHLLIDRKMRSFGMAGNISRIHFELEETTELEAVQKVIQRNTIVRQVSKIKYKTQWPLLPKWIEATESNVVFVQSFESPTTFENEVLKAPLNNQAGLVKIVLCEVADGSKHLVISMHHALFDHQGMMNFIHSLNGNFSGSLFRESEPVSWLQIVKNGAIMNYDLFRRSVWKFGSLFQDFRGNKITPKYKIIRFDAAETATISKNAWQAGSKIGMSAFYVSVVARSLQALFQDRNQESQNLWFSIPHNQRRLGAQGHLLSNKLSFLFFRLTEAELKTTELSVQSVITQLKSQIKFRAADKYVDMMKVMRFVPMPIYEGMVSVPSKGKLSSFGFSDLGEDKLNMSEIAGAKVKQVHRYPPVPSPPGFNVASLKKVDGLELIIGYGKELISEDELGMLVKRIRKGLLTTV